MTDMRACAGSGLGLSEATDRQQLEGLGRLARALSAGASQPPSKGADSATLQQQRWSMQQSAAILNWLVEVSLTARLHVSHTGTMADIATRN